MSCTYDKEKLTGYFDGELDAAEKVEVEKHISACSECLRELGEIKSAAQLVRILPRLKAPASVAQAVTREIAPARRVDSLARYRKSILWTFAAAAALLVVANVAYFIDGSRSPEKTGSTAAMPAHVPAPPVDAVDAKPVARGAEEQLARGRQAEHKAEPVLPLVEEKRAAADKGATFGARPVPPAELDKAKEEGERAGQGQNRGLAEKAAAKGEPAKPMAVPATAPAPAPTKEGGEPLAKKESAAPGAAAPAAPPAPAKPTAKADSARREVETMKQLAEPPAGGRVGGLQQDKQRDEGQSAAAAALRFTVGSPQPEATRSKAEQILAKLGVATAADRANNKDAAAAAPVPSQSLAVDLTPTQFEELKRQLEADTGVHLMAMVTVEETDRLRAANSAQSGAPKPAPSGLGGGAGAKNDLDGKLADSNDLKKTAEPRADEARKALDVEGKGKDEKSFKDPGQQQQPFTAGKKAQQEPLRRYVLVFLPPAAEKK